ncbi:Inner membrane transport permease YbhR, partial [Armadillidium nasatum]
EVVELTIKIELYRALEEFFVDYVVPLTRLNLTTASLPIKMEDPVYATEEFSFRNFVAPGILITTVYFMAAGLTSLSFIIERKEGLLERSWVSGVILSEVLLSHLVTQVLIMLVQIAIVMICLFAIFQIPCVGNYIWVILLSILQGLCGMSYGFMVSAVSKDEMTAIQLMLGTFYPLLLISGIVWPLEGMPNAISCVICISFFIRLKTRIIENIEL